MEKATGIRGLFIRSEDPLRLARWYREALGIDTYSEELDGVWRQEAGPTVWSPFPQDTDYFGRPGARAVRLGGGPGRQPGRALAARPGDAQPAVLTPRRDACVAR
jgi:hypothetical protein